MVQVVQGEIKRLRSCAKSSLTSLQVECSFCFCMKDIQCSYLAGEDTAAHSDTRGKLTDLLCLGSSALPMQSIPFPSTGPISTLSYLQEGRIGPYQA